MFAYFRKFGHQDSYLRGEILINESSTSSEESISTLIKNQGFTFSEFERRDNSSILGSF